MLTKTKNEKGKKLFNAREGNNIIRREKYLEEGCCGTSLFPKRPISEQYIYSEKEGWGQWTYDQIEGVQRRHSFPANQNEEFTTVEDLRKLDLMFMCLTFSERPKESDVSIGKNSAPVSMCALDLHQPYVFAKLLKISMALLRKTGIHIVIYLDEMLIIGRTREETTALRETVTLLLQCLGFVINQKNSVSPVQEKEFLEKIVISKEFTIFLSKKKLQLIRVSGSTSESTDKFWS